MDINAFITRIDARFTPSGPLQHLRVGVKDMYDTAGVRTTAACAAFKDRVPQTDAVAVSALKAAGAYIVGKTNMHRLGMGTTSLVSDFGPVRNPRNTGFVAGGSSGGSAAAVAAGMCDATLDTDAVGSCRLPAACCGVVGFKGTYGLINNKGVFGGDDEPSPVILALAHAAVMARDVATVKIVVEALTGTALEAGNQHPRIREIEAYGFDRNYFDITNIEADRANAVSQVFGDADILMLPTLAHPVPTIEEAGSNENAVSPQNTLFANYFGLPAISVPHGTDGRGMPVGLHIVGKPNDDATVLAVAARYEVAR